MATLRALVLCCSLKLSPAASSSELLGREVPTALADHEAACQPSQPGYNPHAESVSAAQAAYREQHEVDICEREIGEFVAMLARHETILPAEGQASETAVISAFTAKCTDLPHRGRGSGVSTSPGWLE